MENQIEYLNNKIKLTTYFVGILTILIFILTVMFIFQNSKEQNKIIRVRGIIVEDINGKERILIGAPIPYAKNRIRTDTTRVRKLWSQHFTDGYMDWYKKYNHDNAGILILDSLGFDRVALGSLTPDPNIGNRIGPQTGVIINDKLGFERSGYGVLDINGRERVVLELDNDNGTVGLVLTIREDGTTGLKINGEDGMIFLGKIDSISHILKDRDKFNGLFIKHKAGKVIDLNTIQGNNKKQLLTNR